MLRTKKAKKILTKREQRHLTESGIKSFEGLKRQAEIMAGKKPFEVCLDCKSIATKMGLLNSNKRI